MTPTSKSSIGQLAQQVFGWYTTSPIQKLSSQMLILPIGTTLFIFVLQKESRKKQEVLRTAGTSNFAVVRERLVEEHGADKFSDLDFFDATHKKSNGQFVYKVELKAKYYDENRTMTENARVVPRGVVRSDWEFLCHFWSTPEGKKRAERGRASRDAQDVLHTAGGTSFARRRAIMDVERGGADQYGDLDFFDATHMNSQGVFPSSKAATISTTARNRYVELSSAPTAGFPTTPIDIVQLQHQALVENIGPERHSRVRGKGLGPTPSRTHASSSTQPDPRDEKIANLEMQVAELKATVAHIAQMMRETNVENPSNIPRQQGVRDPTSSSRPNKEEADDLGDPVDGIARRTL